MASTDTTTDSDHYTQALKNLQESSENNSRERLTSLVVLQHDNARCYTGEETAVFISQFGFDIMARPPYSSDLAQSDYWLFAPLKRRLSKGRNEDLNLLDAAVKDRSQGVPKDFFCGKKRVKLDSD